MAKFVLSLRFWEMKNLIPSILLLLLVTSCQFFETKKISSDQFYEEEIEEIDWKDVDRYPLFSGCEAMTEKINQKKCFERILSNHLYASIHSRKMSVRYEMNDTVPLEFAISNEGVIRVQKIVIDSTIQKELPLLEQWILKSIDSLPQVVPAFKRGIPVNTEFTLPIVIKTQL